MNSPVPLDQLVLEIRFYSQQTALNMIEVGKRLLRAKEQVPHGEWGRWLSEKVDYTERSAQRFMKVAETFANTTHMSDLRPAQVYALLDAPEPIRQEILGNHNPKELTGKQIKELSRRLLQSETEIEIERKAREYAEEENSRLKQENQRLASRPAQVIEKEVVPPDYATLKSNNRQYEETVKRIIAEKEKLSKDLEVERDAARLSQKASQDNYDQRKEFEARADMISGRIALFIRDMAAFGYMGADYFRCSDYSRKKYEKAIERLEKLTRDLREQMHVLSIEGDTKIINAEVIEND
ncbi:DUF3102 domain-containing protein [Sporomusa termitida]|uniref:DUF3102 domain-containing protein n=1 Tax=Sporomusa termitida TaxID=2377 RepID=A0A517DSA7_9FIRM|nr:DUF3102 domain-containing protein [Sporomusa termitida]QDR80251.1 hypothetical protein SPTER_15700 [Sporomusa termitida]